ncbi:MAG: hypothetical protein GDA56_04900 [Hormoscilla sp. GM7CHS1pb]|nr:hypothetical protein [Hormoscilla sp. GM7CHS1pb]
MIKETDIDLSNNSIDENVAPNTVVGTFSTTDPDTGDTFTYQLVAGTGDTDNSAFTIDGDQLRINSSPDFETQSSYSILVQSTDPGGLSYSENLTININNVNENLQPEIVKNIGGSSFDGGYGIATDSNGNAWVTGYFNGSIDIDGDGNNDLTSNGNFDSYVAKFDRNGDLVKALNIGGSSRDYGSGIATDSNGNVWTTGLFNGSIDIDGDGNNDLTSNGNFDSYVAKFDHNGDLVKALNIGGSSRDYGSGIATDSNGNVWTTGLFNGSIDIDGDGNNDLTSNGNFDSYVAKFDHNGDLVKALNIGGSSRDYGRGIATDSNGNVWTTGLFNGSIDIDGDGNNDLTSNGNFDSYVAKFDHNGDLVKALNIGGSSRDYGRGIATDSNGNVWTTGLFNGSIDIDGDGNNDLTSNGNFDSYVAKFDHNGDLVKALNIGGSSRDYGRGIATDSNGNVWTTGLFNGSIDIDGDGNNDLTSNGNFDSYVAKFDHNGDLVKALNIGGSSRDYGSGIATDSNGNVWTTGLFNGSIDIDGDGNNDLTSNGNSDSYVFKFSEATNAAPTDIDLSNNSIDENVAPNTVVGTFSTTDPDTGDTFTYQLVAGTGDTDNSAFTIDGDQLRINSSPDFETQSSYSILVQSTDPGGLSYSENLTININNVNENLQPEIVKNIGGSSFDGGYGIATDSNGNAWVTGYFNGSIDIDGDGNNDLTSNGNFDSYVAKFDRNGDLVKALNIGGSSRDYGSGIATDSNGNVWTTGLFNGSIDIDGDGNNDLTSNGNFDSYVAKFDHNGDLVKALNIGGSSRDYGSGIATDSNGNVWTTGLFNGSIDIDGDGNNDLTSNGNFDSYVAKFDHNGDLVKALNIGGSSRDYGSGIATDSNGNVWTTGLFNGSIDIDGDGNNDLTSNGNFDSYVAKFDHNGDLVKALNIGGSSRDYGRGIATDSNGNVWTTGLFNGSIDIDGDGNNDLTSNGNFDSYVAKFDHNGDLVKALNIGGSSRDYGRGIATDSNGNVWTTGLFNGSIDIDGDGNNDLTSNGNFDSYVAKFDHNGDLVKALNIGGSSRDYGSGIATDSNGNVWTTGLFNGSIDIDGDGNNDLTSNGNSDSYVFKFSEATNAAPTDIDLSNNSIDENVAPNTVVGTFSTTDPDTGDTFTYQLVAGTGDTDNSAFTIDGDQLRINSSPDFETQSSYSILVQSTDPGGLSYSENLTININNVNEGPTDIDLSNNSIDENVAPNTVVGTFSTTDPDTGDTFTYQLVAGTGDTDNSAFTIDGDQLRINSSPDFETQSSYSILVQSTDPGGLSYSENLTININNVNEGPTDIDLSNNSIDENVAPNTVVGTFSTTDPDTGDTFTYQLVAGTGDTDNSAFTIDGDQLRINSSPDFETQSSYSILVQSTDPGGLSYSENLTININNVNEGPTDIDLSNNSIDENVAPNTVVGTFSTTDPDTGDTFTYQLVAGTGDTDNSAFTIDGDQLRINSSPDFETQSSYSILVQSTDPGGLSYSENLTININNVNEGPTDIDLSNNSIDENVAPNTVVGTFSTTDPDTGDTFTYQLVAGTGDTDNSAFTIDGDQLRINSSPDFETQSSYSILVQSTDPGGLSYSENLTININNVNEGPTDIDLSNNSIDENVAPNTVVGTFSTTDPDTGDTFTYQLVAGTGDTDNSAFTIDGDQLRINSSPDFETQSSYSILVQSTDPGGLSYSENLTININNVNEGPTDIDLSNNSIDENVAPNTVVGTFSTTDPDTGDTFTYQLVAGTGDTDNSAFTIDGDQLRINSSPDFETQSSYSILVQSTDPGGLSYSENLTININNVNEGPTDIDLSNNSIDENVAPNTVVGTFSTTDPDTGDTFTYQLVAGTGDTDNSAFTIDGDQLRINSSPDFETQSSYSILVQSTDPGGLSYSENLTININNVNEGPTDIDLSNNSIDENVAPNTVVGTFSTTDPDTGDTFTYQLVAGTGDTDNSAFTIDGDQLRINSSPDFETQSSYSILVQSTDPGGLSYSENLTININNVNEGPTDIDLSNNSIDENVAPNTVVGTFSTTDPDTGDTFTYQLVAGTGDTDNSAFTIDGDQLRINSSPDFETQSSYSILVQSTDPGGLSYSENLTININNVNEGPTDIDLSNNSIDENVAPNTVVGTFSTTDPDTGDTFTYQLVAGTGDTDNSAFTIDGDQLRINSSPDFETQSSYSILVQSTDPGGLSYSENLTININNVNEGPTDIDLSNNSIDENVAPNTVVGTFSTTDPDTGDTFTYQLVAGTGDTDNSAFTIDGDQLRINSSPDFETQSSYSILVQSTDPGGLSYSENLTININNVNEGPTDIDLSNNSIDENVAPNTVVGTFSTTDPDTGDTFTYQLVAGTGDTDNSAFTIDGDQLRINSSPDFETQSSYSILVQSTDPGGLSYSENLTININNVNEGPTDIDLSNNSIDENVAPNTVVGTFSTTDPDTGDTFTYQLVAGTGDTDNSAFTIDGDQLRINSSPDFETQSSYSILVQSTDPGGLSYSENLTININNVNEGPTDIDLSNNSIDENVAPNTVVGTFSTTDPDTGDTFTYQLVAGTGDTDNSAFTIDGDQLRINSSPDFETQSSYSILVQSTDPGGLSYSENLTININNVNEGPTDIDLSNNSIDENVAPNTVVGTFSTTDPDTGDTFTYQLVAGTGDTDNSAFTIDGDQLRINSSPDFETQSSYSILVQSTDPGGLSYSENLTININNVNEGPTDIDLSNNSIDENVAPNTVVGTFSTTDPDTGDTFTYQLVAGTGDTDNSAFTIDGDQLRINSSPDFETQSSYSILVQSTDPGGLSYSENLTININNVNEGPTDIDLSNNSIDENVAPNTVVGTFSTTDPDTGDTFTYQLVAGTGDTDNSAFTIDGDQLRINSSPDFETQSSYSILVQSTDPGGLSYSENLTININNVNEGPTDIDLSNNSIDENVAPNTVVGTFSTTDPDTGDTFTYQLVAGTGDTDNSAFTIDGDQLRINSSPDFETQSSYSILVQSTDPGGLSYSENLTININNVNEGPTDIDLSNNSIDENVAPNTVVGTFSTTDPDTGDTFTYQLVAGTGDTDNSAFTIDGDQLRINSSPDFETQSSYSILVQSTDPGGLSYSENLTININNVNEGSPRTSISATTALMKTSRPTLLSAPSRPPTPIQGIPLPTSW